MGLIILIQFLKEEILGFPINRLGPLFLSIRYVLVQLKAIINLKERRKGRVSQNTFV